MRGDGTVRPVLRLNAAFMIFRLKAEATQAHKPWLPASLEDAGGPTELRGFRLEPEGR
jgi:hypothetical protein